HCATSFGATMPAVPAAAIVGHDQSHTASLPAWVIPRTPVAELLVMDYDETLTIPDTITALANLTYTQHEKRHPEDSSRQAVWRDLSMTYYRDWETFTERWNAELPARYERNNHRAASGHSNVEDTEATLSQSVASHATAGHQEPSVHPLLTTTDLVDHLIQLDAVERASIERINRAGYFAGIDRATIFDYGATHVRMQPGALSAIRDWLQRYNYAEHPWSFTRALEVVPPGTEEAESEAAATLFTQSAAADESPAKTAAEVARARVRFTDAHYYQPLAGRDWAILSVNWSRDIILGALLPMLNLTTPVSSPSSPSPTVTSDAETTLSPRIVAPDDIPVVSADTEPCTTATTDSLTLQMQSDRYRYLLNKVVCNDLVYAPSTDASAADSSNLDSPNGRATGELPVTVRTGIDKLREFRRMVAIYQRDLDAYETPHLATLATALPHPDITQQFLTLHRRRHLLSIYVGDSVNDLLCLLEADVGIIVGHSRSVTQWCRDMGVPVIDLPPVGSSDRVPFPSLPRSAARHASSAPVREGGVVPPSRLGPLYRMTHWDQFSQWTAQRDAEGEVPV
ncbi:hypothetical protein IWQ60_007714, partial [Tieghemiomyces parasiticus]